MASNGFSQKRKHKKNYYLQGAKKFKSGVLEPGMKGVMVTCNNDEKQCVREVYDLLNEYADVVFGPENEYIQDCDVQNKNELEKNLENEIKALKTSKDMRRFQQVNTKVKNIIFIRTKIPDPTKLVQCIFEDIIKVGKKKTRYILKITPVTATCKFSLDAFKANVFEFVEELSKSNTSSTTYKAICKVRHNSSVSKDHIIWYCREAVEKFLPSWLPSLTEPETIISVDVLQSVCCLGILRNYSQYKKYNLAEVLNQGNCIVPISHMEGNEGSIINKSTVGPAGKVNHSDVSAPVCQQPNTFFQESKKKSNSFSVENTLLQIKGHEAEDLKQDNIAELKSHADENEDNIGNISVQPVDNVNCAVVDIPVGTQSQDEFEDIDLFFTVKE